MTSWFGARVSAYPARHDVVYRSPADEGAEGFPLGDGDLGAIVWTPPEEIHFTINKCNTWDDQPPGNFRHWGDREESNTVLRHAGELAISNGLPCFNWMYQRTFDGRLSLDRAEASIQSTTPFSRVRVESFVSAVDKVLAVRYRDRTKENLSRKVALRRWGTRCFGHWYAVVSDDERRGLEGTKTFTRKNFAWIKQKTRSLEFVTMAAVVGGKVEASRTHSREAVFETAPAKSADLQIYLTCATTEETRDPARLCRERLRKAIATGFDRLRKSHRAWWRDFWSKSFVKLENDYLENLWYMNLYLSGSQMRGDYPPMFQSTLFSWLGDIRPWQHFYHWNMQIQTWPLYAANHPELTLCHHTWRRRGLEHAMEDARGTKPGRGAFYTDVCNRRGYQAVGADLALNYTPGAQIALDMFRYYEYTGDRAFLAETAYPVMREVARFYLGIFRKGADGRYHVPRSTPYEAVLTTRDTHTDLAHGGEILLKTARAAKILERDAPLARRCLQVAENVAPFPVAKIPPGWLAKRNGRYRYEYAQAPDKHDIADRLQNYLGIPRLVVLYGRGKTVLTDKIHASGYDIKTGKPLHKGITDPARNKFLFTGSECAAVVPGNLIGLDQKGTEEFKIARNTALLQNTQYGHNVHPVRLARLGLAEALEYCLSEWPDHFQCYPNGLMSFFSSRLDNHHPYWDKKAFVSPEVQETGERVKLPKHPFATFYTEPQGMLQAAINEMLLQSHQEWIRVFPALPKGKTARFDLAARGGFRVASECIRGKVAYVHIRSNLGETCALAWPWEKGKARVTDAGTGREIPFKRASSGLKFATRTGRSYLVRHPRGRKRRLDKFAPPVERNRAPKDFSEAILGKKNWC